ncbi:hypothetical protein NW762_009514 [Fusarium torreyae]|uniref:Mid2 domain-containing protein n=1 Tax=Fusarium torreyae TaxID=1237075 RepID=A0A9W8RW37_9HYPO|nr:hypothetical protein NW762_009514 [Fusarium torreyae]
MANSGTSTINLFSDIDKLMATIFPTRIAFPSGKDRTVPRTWKTSHGSTFIAAVPSGKDKNDEGGVLTVTETTTMNPYTEQSRDNISTTTSSSPSTQLTATPDNTTENDTRHETTAPTSSQSPSSLSSTLHHSRGLSDGTIAAIVIGVLLGLAVIAAGIWFFIRRRRRRWPNSQATPPQTPIYNPPPPRSPLPTPPPLPELSAHTERASTPEDSWVSYGRENLSPTPQPAVAEVKSFTRARQKPRVYTVTGGRIAELPGSESQTSYDDRDDDLSPISPVSEAPSSHVGDHIVSPVSLTSRFSSSQADQRRGGSPGGAF